MGDLRKRKHSRRRQMLFDLFCAGCFLLSTLACSWTVFEYYRFPQNRCSSNSKQLFGINAENGGSNILSPNIWIMSQTTYSSFCAMVLLLVFALCGGVTALIQCIIGCKRRKKMRKVIVDKVAEAAKVAPPAGMAQPASLL